METMNKHGIAVPAEDAHYISVIRGWAARLKSNQHALTSTLMAPREEYTSEARAEADKLAVGVVDVVGQVCILCLTSYVLRLTSDV